MFALHRFRSRFAAIALGITVGILPSVSWAQSTPYITDKDLQVAVRTFSFVYDLPKGDIEIEIIYNPNNAVSSNEASQLNKIIAQGIVFAARTLKAKMVPVSEMGSTGSRFAYITHGLQSDYGVLMERARNRQILTFSTDFQCVDSQKCVMGMTADPNIKIEISRTAAAASKLEFSQALKLMVREVE